MKSLIQLDGWQIAIDWTALYYGQSFFVPSINWKHDKAALQASADAAGCGVGIKGVIENKVRGIRVWITAPVL